MMTPRSSITNEEIPQQISRAPVPISRPSLPAATPAPLALSRGSRALPLPLPAPINIPTNSRWPAQRLVLYTPESPPTTTRGRFSESGVLLQTASSDGSRARERELSEGSDYEERFYHGGSWSTGSVVSAQHEYGSHRSEERGSPTSSSYPSPAFSDLSFSASRRSCSFDQIQSGYPYQESRGTYVEHRGCEPVPAMVSDRSPCLHHYHHSSFSTHFVVTPPPSTGPMMTGRSISTSSHGYSSGHGSSSRMEPYRSTSRQPRSSSMRDYSIFDKQPQSKPRERKDGSQRERLAGVPKYVSDSQASREQREEYLAMQFEKVLRDKKFGKPNKSYATLCGEEFLSSPAPHYLHVQEIFCGIIERFAYFRFDPRLLYHGIRHVLSSNYAFERMDRPWGDQSGQARMWRIKPGQEELFLPLSECESSPVLSSSGSSFRSIPMDDLQIQELDGDEPVRMIEEQRGVVPVRPCTPIRRVAGVDLERTPVAGPCVTNDDTPMAIPNRSSRRSGMAQPVLRSQSALSTMSGGSPIPPPTDLNDPQGSFPTSDIRGVENMQYGWFNIPDVSMEGLGTKNTQTLPSMKLGSTHPDRARARTPFDDRNNYQGSFPRTFLPVQQSVPIFTSQGRFDRESIRGNVGPIRPTSGKTRRPVPIRALSSLSLNRPSAPTLAVQNTTVSSLASAMDMSLVRSRRPEGRR